MARDTNSSRASINTRPPFKLVPLSSPSQQTSSSQNNSSAPGPLPPDTDDDKDKRFMLDQLRANLAEIEANGVRMDELSRQHNMYHVLIDNRVDAVREIDNRLAELYRALDILSSIMADLDPGRVHQ